MPTTRSAFSEALLPRSERTERIAPRCVSAAERPWPRKIIVASDGSASADSALVAARLLAERAGGDVELLTVYAPRIPLPHLADRIGTRRCEGPDRSAVAAQLRSVRRQRRTCVPGSPRWPVRLEVGDPAWMIVSESAGADPELLVLGIGNTDLYCRRHGQELPLRISSYTECPMLATGEAAGIPARRAILVVSATQQHDATARATLGCMDALGVLWVIIQTPGRDRSRARNVRDSELPSLQAPFDIRGEINQLAPSIEVRVMHLSGDAANAAITLAADVRADLIATPIYGSPRGSRPFWPNLAGRLLQTSRCSVLVVPELPHGEHLPTR